MKKRKPNTWGDRRRRWPLPAWGSAPLWYLCNTLPYSFWNKDMPFLYDQP